MVYVGQEGIWLKHRLFYKVRFRECFCMMQFLFPGFLGVSVFYLFPFVDVCRRSFLQSATGRFIGVDNYKQVLENKAFWRAVKNTAVYVGTGVCVLILLSFVIALLLRKAFGNKGMLSIMLLPMAIPAAVMVLLLEVIINRNGLWNGWLGLQIDYMNTRWAVLIVLLAFWWKNVAYMVVLWLTGLAGIPKETEEAAAIDGAGRLAKVIYITLPQLTGSFFVILILSILQAFKSYREIWMTSGNYPQENIYLLQHLLQNWYLKLEFDKMAALTVMLSLFLLIFCMLLQDRLERNKERT